MITFETLQLFENFFSKLYFHFTIPPNLKNSSNFYNQYYYNPFPVSKLLFLVSYHLFKHPFPVQIQIKISIIIGKFFPALPIFFPQPKKLCLKIFSPAKIPSDTSPKGFFLPFGGDSFQKKNKQPHTAN